MTQNASALLSTAAAPMNPARRALNLAALGLAACTLAGCAAFGTVTSDVSSFGEWPRGRAPGSYVFERLPSQQANAAQQDALEAAARPALAKAGFVPAADPARADVTVQLGARFTRTQTSPWDDPFWPRWGLWGGYPYRRGGFGMSASFNFSSQVEREVALLIRDRANGQPLYEARASNEGTSTGDAALLGAMYQAALADFPTPAVSPRRVSIALP